MSADSRERAYRRAVARAARAIARGASAPEQHAPDMNACMACAWGTWSRVPLIMRAALRAHYRATWLGLAPLAAWLNRWHHNRERRAASAWGEAYRERRAMMYRARAAA